MANNSRLVPPGALPSFVAPQDNPPETNPDTQPTDQAPATPGPSTTPAAPGPETEPSRRPARGSSRPEPGTAKTVTAETRTDTSSLGEAPIKPREIIRVDAKTAARAGVVLVGILATVGGWMARRATRGNATLRKPTKDEAHAIADPLAKIFGRHARANENLDDLFDLGAAITAVGDYLDAGPLLNRHTHPGQIPTFNEES
jgi:hypothetical protein